MHVCVTICKLGEGCILKTWHPWLKVDEAESHRHSVHDINERKRGSKTRNTHIILYIYRKCNTEWFLKVPSDGDQIGDSEVGDGITVEPRILDTGGRRQPANTLHKLEVSATFRRAGLHEFSSQGAVDTWMRIELDTAR